ncbi:MAG: PrpF family protein [Candidatus Rokubacteria bacterium]|nr:PrpF family protein [Candidatus Rokubacteria bacterium]
MTQKKIRAVFMRGGTSRALFFREQDLPGPGPARDRILLAALGSPDPYGRQLDGLGGGISSLSKACIIGPPTQADAEVDYTFAQVDVRTPVVDYKGNCGNCSSAVGPFAIDERLVKLEHSDFTGETLVRIHNTNTKKLIVAHVPVQDGEAAVEGDFALAGVPRRGARIALDFLDPGGAGTGRLLPTGSPREMLDGLEASLVDATNPVVFVRAKDLGLAGTETPQAIDADPALAARLEAIRVEAARRMGIPGSAAVPKIALVAPPAPFAALDGARYGAESVDVVARVISMGNCHRAFALTAAMCLAVAARMEGTLVHECASGATRASSRLPAAHAGLADPAPLIRLGHPSGVLPIDAAVSVRDGAPWAESVTVYRTARRLMEGYVRIP